MYPDGPGCFPGSHVGATMGKLTIETSFASLPGVEIQVFDPPLSGAGAAGAMPIGAGAPTASEA